VPTPQVTVNPTGSTALSDGDKAAIRDASQFTSAFPGTVLANAPTSTASISSQDKADISAGVWDYLVSAADALGVTKMGGWFKSLFTAPAPIQISFPTSGALCIRLDIENIFGPRNVIKWAIVSGSNPTSGDGTTEITNRVNWAIDSASADFIIAMNQGGYTLPLDGVRAMRWQTNMVAVRSGYYLYSWLRQAQRGPDGKPSPDYFSQWFDWWQEQIDFVRARKLHLDGSVFGKGTNAPEATHEPSHAAYGPGIRGYGEGRIPPPGPFVG
jgi:hypothetical protein